MKKTYYRRIDRQIFVRYDGDDDLTDSLYPHQRVPLTNELRLMPLQIGYIIKPWRNGKYDPVVEITAVEIRQVGQAMRVYCSDGTWFWECSTNGKKTKVIQA